eukprot:m.378815 g.378815  ORF g.378815 m.378815 type:complete len:60 (-) comp20938_c0_seq4:129-308(-)
MVGFRTVVTADKQAYAQRLSSVHESTSKHVQVHGYGEKDRPVNPQMKMLEEGKLPGMHP